ncbi:Sterol desaturase/sphingolipid hydroxylase, fatty acid hydroxylase superfamily [Robiginitalea myxolifaciens]|uniref:Sterol desaturase/sphingolipid hydroxylase, fatty acid hydroxylase superfamily n=1 Tax=Robiginitalea myxolifaciens TaxID=400055 RepID=A0A1I6FPC4_9FLAO|nr:sterol desaturase family protein [Robiginitalea myxolifaciens]SFR31802.1 Sterol desaturase/sphingolipid hydroxylase, fatty acid hydroxylase superfamily [Robiginitalea myxolifaciens]
MEAYATALLYAIPFFMVLMLLEMGYGHFTGKQTYRVMDTVSSISSGLTNIIKDSLGLVLVLVSYPYLVENLALIELKATWLVWLSAFLVIDFAGYWNHRLSHRVNIFWNQHVIHHSSEEFNLACALRQSISNVIGYFPLFLIPAALLGVPEQVIAIIAPIHLFGQFWYHTQHIGKLGWLEYIIVTPSQHRVHHAINPIYIDKNLGQILCIWDRMFGTFQEELEEEPPQYGVLKPAATWNPLYINFQHLWRLLQDAWHARSWWDKMRIWFMPTGWRPADVVERFPRTAIENVYDFKKYRTTSTRLFRYYVIFQLLATLALLIFMFYHYGALGNPGLLALGLLATLAVYGYTSLMDGAPYGVWIETGRALLGIWLLLWGRHLLGGMEPLESILGIGLAYCLISLLGGVYFGRLQALPTQSGSTVRTS